MAVAMTTCDKNSRLYIKVWKCSPIIKMSTFYLSLLMFRYDILRQILEIKIRKNIALNYSSLGVAHYQHFSLLLK